LEGVEQTVRLASVLHEGSACWGEVQNGAVSLFGGISSLTELINQSNGPTQQPQQSGVALPLSTAELLPPVIPSRNIFCVGWNYRNHFDEGKGRVSRTVKEIPPHPTFFTKNVATINSPFAAVPLHASVTKLLDWEVELAVVIGKAGASINELNALDYVFGYCVANDFSARDLQSRHGGQWFKGKSLDGTCPLGPVLVTRGDIADPQDLDIECRVNGVVKQHSNTRHQVYPVSRIIAELSLGLTLQPGDVILTGTPAGVGATREPPERLIEGDVVESEIPGIGIIRNTVSASTQRGRPQQLGLV
jgi:2,4-diketo-3-deoxy-L-fuconate hydrolase